MREAPGFEAIISHSCVDNEISRISNFAIWSITQLLVYTSYLGWLVGFVALRPKSTAMVIAGPSVHLTTLFPGQA